jgi:hypothetical protein
MSITTMSPNKLEREVSRVIDRAEEVGGHYGAGGWEFLEGSGRSIEGSEEVSEVEVIVWTGWVCFSLESFGWVNVAKERFYSIGVR